MLPTSNQTTGTVVCNGCLALIDLEWEPQVKVGEYAFHRRCAPVCTVCAGSLDHDMRGVVRDFYILDSDVEFVAARGYQVKLKVCCCPDCYSQALHDDP